MAASPDLPVALPHANGRVALLAGATGLIGRELLRLLRESPRYAHTHVLVRRANAALVNDARTTIHVVDFAHLRALPPIADAYIALGTTIKVAGSKEAFRAVDFDHVVATATAARAAGATRLAVVSALGADVHSSVFYNQVKGEMQAAVGALGFESVVIAQPSLLIGDRAVLGQPVRAGEVWVTRLLTPVMALVPRSVRPIRAAAVAASMVEAVAGAHPGVRVLGSGAMQR